MPGRRRSRLRWISAWLLACAWTAQAAAPHFQLDDTGLDAVEIRATRALLDEAVSRLPPRWARSLGSSVRVQWRDNLPAHVHGRTTGRGLMLRRALLDDWIAHGPGAGGDAPSQALATVIHELAHLHDRSTGGGLSRDPRLLDLAGWQVRPFRILPRLGGNAFSDRSPDPYELDGPAEFVAVNLEHFLLDPAYACRRPALAAYFSEWFGHAPPAADCAPGMPFVEPDAEAGAPLLELDAARVYQVDYLLAGPNQRLMSRWGHSMLRLVVCAPGRPPGPDCRLDLAHHRVLSFRAFVGDVQISNWRGLTGSYPSRLFVLPLDQVVEEYTRVELRRLVSLPLQLSPDEITALLQRAARVHWSYDGSYRFIGNNCAVETFKLLHDGVPRLAGGRLASVTPTGLLRRLERHDLVDSTALTDPDGAVRLGYVFRPLDDHYAQLFDVAREGLELPYAGVEAWLELAPGERSPWLQRVDLRSGAALLVLEQAALRRQELLARDELKRRFSDRGDDDALAAARDLLRIEGSLARPAALAAGGGYGLPQQAERAALALAAGQRVAQRREDAERLHVLVREHLSPARRTALDGIEANLALLGGRLRELHRRQGGLRLPE